MKITFTEVKKTLSSCHLSSKQLSDKFMLDIEDPNYYLTRTSECINAVQHGKEEEDNLILGIQLMAVRLTKIRKELEPEKPKIKTKIKIADTGTGTGTGTGSEDNV